MNIRHRAALFPDPAGPPTGHRARGFSKGLAKGAGAAESRERPPKLQMAGVRNRKSCRRLAITGKTWCRPRSSAASPAIYTAGNNKRRNNTNKQSSFACLQLTGTAPRVSSNIQAGIAYSHPISPRSVRERSAERLPGPNVVTAGYSSVRPSGKAPAAGRAGALLG